MNIFNRKNFFTILSVLVFSLFASFHVVLAQNTDLVSQWDGDAVSRTNSGVSDVSDLKGDNTGILYDTHDATPGKVGNAFNLSGGNEYIAIKNSANLNFGTNEPFSLEAWFNWNARRSAAINDIIRKSNYPVEGPGAGYWLRINVPDNSGTKGELEFFIGETVGIPNQPRGKITTPVSPQIWYHVVATRDSSGTMKLYVDGELKGTAKAPDANATSKTPFTIGAWQDRFGGQEFFSGLIDEVSVYSRALDSSEIKSSYDEAKDDIKIYDKIAPYLKKGETPGQCRTVKECRAYCDLEGNFDECIDFAFKAGLIETDDPYLKALQDGTAPGGCIGENACADYCGIASHIKECVAFLEKYSVFPSDVLKILHDTIAACEQEPDFVACIESGPTVKGKPVDLGANIKIGVSESQAEQKAQDAMRKGESPGQCKDEVSCRKYCEDIDHLEECISFVEKFNLASADELKEMRLMATVKKAGTKFPGNCKTKESCLTYCESSAHAVECMEFAQKAGFIPKEDAEAVNKIIPYLKSGGKLPGGCTTKESCDVYCESDTHASECVDFAVGAGFMTKEEAEIVKKVGGKGPGNCRSREACDNYCKDETHINECVDFAVKAGFISQEEADQAKKYKITSGPGGCKSKADCEVFCVVNQDTCFNWAKDHGMLSEEDLKNIEQQKDFMKSLDTAPPEWLACMNKELGSDFFGRFKAGKITQIEAKSPALEKAQRKCGESMGQDIRKEIEACLGKATCTEFNLCSDALPKGNQQSSRSGSEDPSGSRTTGQGQQQGQQDENGKKFEVRARACIQEKMDACLVLSCSEFEACTKSLQQGGGEQSGQKQDQQQGQGTPNLKFNAKMQACQDEKVNACLTLSCSEFDSCVKSLQQGAGEQSGKQGQNQPNLKMEAKFKTCQKEKINACLGKSCSEFDACVKSLQQGAGGGEQQQQKQGQGEQDPAVNAKVKACQQEKVNVCITKPCSEFQACLNSLGGGGGGGEQQQQGTPDPAVQAKFMSWQPPKQTGPLPGGGDQSGIPQGYSSWQAFCMANSGDSRCVH